jgi:hypothetical protein
MPNFLDTQGICFKLPFLWSYNSSIPICQTTGLVNSWLWQSPPLNLYSCLNFSPFKMPSSISLLSKLDSFWIATVLFYQFFFFQDKMFLRFPLFHPIMQYSTEKLNVFPDGIEAGETNRQMNRITCVSETEWRSLCKSQMFWWWYLRNA